MAPLVPLPVFEVSFERIAMDIIGPLPRSRSGNRYVLVVCDYATRWPEGAPLTLYRSRATIVARLAVVRISLVFAFSFINGRRLVLVLLSI